MCMIMGTWYVLVLQKDPLSLELRNVTTLAGLCMLHKVGWVLGNESGDLHYHLM